MLRRCWFYFLCKKVSNIGHVDFVFVPSASVESVIPISTVLNNRYYNYYYANMQVNTPSDIDTVIKIVVLKYVHDKIFFIFIPPFSFRMLHDKDGLSP